MEYVLVFAVGVAIGALITWFLTDRKRDQELAEEHTAGWLEGYATPRSDTGDDGPTRGQTEP